MRVTDGRASVERYWRFSPKSRIRYKTDAEYEEHFRHVFRQSVHRRLRSDSPVLAELSGGLDSSSIVCMADDIVSRGEAQPPRLDTLSYLDLSEPNADDWIYSQTIEQKRGKVGLHMDASLLGSRPSSLEYSDFVPLPGPLNSWNNFKSERASLVRDGGYRAVLSGIGGDEFMGGIPNPSAQLADLIVHFKLVSLAKQLAAWSLVKRRPWIHLFLQAAVELLPASLGRYVIKQAQVEPWIDDKFAKRKKLALQLLGPSESFGTRLPTKRSYVGGVLLTANRLAKVRSSDLWVEEARYPYLDQELIDFVLSIPAGQLLRPGERRSLMRRSLVGLVPDEVLARRTKQLMAHSQLLAFDRGLNELNTAFARPLCSRLGYIVGEKFLEKLCAAKNGKTTDIPRMIRTISLEFWLRCMVARGFLEVETA